MKNIVIYARYSSDKQTEQSIEGQLRVCHEYAERLGFNIINEYIDRAISGTTDKRPAFQKMIEDANLKEFEFILVYKLDRFSRDKYDNVVYKHKLKQNGIKVISATESISNTPEGELMEGLFEMFAEMYVKDLSQKVKRGMRESMIKGNFLGGNVLYGYKVVDKKIVIDEDKAPAIKYLFEEYAKGKPRNQIVDELNQKGFRTNKGKPFSYNSVQYTLNNKKYIGIFDNGEIQNENYYPAIIDERLFDKVQTMLKKNKARPGKNKAKTNYLLSGKAFCGYCGTPLVGVCGTGRLGTVHNYYACSKNYKQHACKKSNEKKLDLEFEIVKKVKNILTEEKIDEIAEKVYKEYKNGNIDAMIRELETQLGKIEKELDKCFEALLIAKNEDMKKRLDEKANSYSLQKQDIYSELKKIKFIQSMQHSKQDIVNILKMMTDGDENDVSYQKKIINNFVTAVYVYDDDITVYFDLFGNNDMPTFEKHESSNFKQIAPPY